ncbi:hypothetical protein Tco_0920599, partial [Tanacetum coccineum]
SGPGCLALLCCSQCASNSACMLLISYLMSLITRRVSASVTGAYGQTLEALPSHPAASGNESHIPGVVSE